MPKIKTDQARLEDVNQILDLNIQEYGSDDVLATRNDFLWRYEQIPDGQAIIPVIRTEAGRVVGFIWVLPLPMRIKQQDVLGATGTNLVIHPDYRQGFGYIKLLRAFNRVFKEEKIPLHFSFISEDKYQQMNGGNKQSFWKKFFIFSEAARPPPEPRKTEAAWTIPFLAKPLDLSQILDSYFVKDWHHGINQQAGRLATPVFVRHSAPRPDKHIQIAPITEVDDSFDQFWKQVEDKYPVMLKRDQAFLKWRFAAVSNRRYQILVARHRQQMLGYLILRCTTIRDLNTGLIMDFLVEDSPLGRKAGPQLLAEAETIFRTEQMAMAAAIIPNFTQEYRLLTKFSYLNVPDAVTPRPFRFASFLHDLNQPELITLTPDDWFVTLADYESF